MRVRIISIAIISVALMVVVRLGYIQILRGDEFALAANRQYSRPHSDEFSRGSIYFLEKSGNRVSAATLIDTYYLVIDPSMVNDPDKYYTALQQYISIDRQVFLSRASKVDDNYEVIERELEKSMADEINVLNLSGVYIYTEKKRYYPGGSLGSTLLGFVGKSADRGDRIFGRAGLEQYYEDVLTRTDGNLYINFFAEIFSNISSVFNDGYGSDLDGSIVLTVEPTVQRQLEEALSKAKSVWNSDTLGGIIIEPETGRVIAMSSYPNFDPNEYNMVTNPEAFMNINIEGIYEMGSTIKPLAMASGIDAGVITPETVYNDAGSIVIDKKRISNYDGRARGETTMLEVLKQSLNLGVVYVEQKLGNRKFAEYMTSYGFGKKTGIDLPGESVGLIGNLSSDRDVNYVTAAFGQGIAVTPIQMASALSTLANGGRLIRPHVVDRIEYRLGIVDSTESVIGVRVLSKETAETVTEMLVKVVDEALIGGRAKMDHYSIAAKTGTAQMVNPETKEYYNDRYLHSFFGYFPASEPRYLIFLFHVNPKGADYASATLTEPFMDLTKFLINYYSIPPDR